MRSQIANRLRSTSIPLNSVTPHVTSKEYSTTLANLAARILYRSPLPSRNDLPVFILNAAAFPDTRTSDYDALLPYVLDRLPDKEELIGGHGYEVVFFAGGEGGNEALQNKKARPGWGWFLQAYHVLPGATRKRLHTLYVVHEKKWIRVLMEMFATVVSPKFRKKIVHGKAPNLGTTAIYSGRQADRLSNRTVSTLSGLALHIPIEDLLIPPSAYLADRRKSPDIYAPYVSGRRAFGVKHPLHTTADGSIRLPRVLREATSFVLLEDNIKIAGIFRISARAQTVEVLREAYDRGQKFIVWKERSTILASSHRREGVGDVRVEELDQTEGFDLHVAAALIKLWYKELREPIFPPTSYRMLEKYYGNPDLELEPSQLLAMLSMDDEWTPIHNETSRHILTMHLLPLLNKVAEYQDWNQMTPDNLAMCFAPSLLRGPDPIEDLKLSIIVRRILVAMIVHWRHLQPLLNTSYEKFEESLRMPEAIEDREDPLEEAQSNQSLGNETQVSGIILQDNEDSDEEDEGSPPPLPPRPRAATVDRETFARSNPFIVASSNRADASNFGIRSREGLTGAAALNDALVNPYSGLRTSSVESVPNSISASSGPYSKIDGVDAGVFRNVSPLRRKPVPSLFSLPRYSTIVTNRPAALQSIQHYNSVHPEDDSLRMTGSTNDLPVYREGLQRHDEPAPSPKSPLTVNDSSIQRKPLPKTASGV